jgi:hypothetical protein
MSNPDTNVLVCTAYGAVNDTGSNKFVHAASFLEDSRLDLRASTMVLYT